MPRTRLSIKKRKAREKIEQDNDESSNDVAHLHYDKNSENFKQEIKPNKCDLSESSSDCDIESYVKPAYKLDLDSSFAPKQKSPSHQDNFEIIECNIFNDINRLSETDSESEITQIPIGIQNFKSIELYNAKLSAAKESIEKYEAKKQIASTSVDIKNLLAAGEKCEEIKKDYAQLSDYDCYSEEEDWEEIKNENRPETLENGNPIKDVEIILDVPGKTIKKKGIDFIASIKRRINRVKKEQQVYIHKVHLLCWIAHGNYVNNVLNMESIQAIALSLLPSQHCYPSSRVDLSYLEQILTWYKKTIKLEEQNPFKSFPLKQNLQHQMNLKESYDKNVFVYIFISILRSLGINVRLIMNIIVEPLRPPNSELCSLSNKPNTDIKASQHSKACEQKTKTESKSLPRASDRVSNITANKPDLQLISAETKSKFEDKALGDVLHQSSINISTSAAINRRVNSSNQSISKNNSKNCDDQTILAKKEKNETSANKSKKRSIYLENKKESEVGSIAKRRVTKSKLKDFETTNTQVNKVNPSKDTSLIKKAFKKEIQNQIIKKLPGRSVKNIAIKRKYIEGSSKEQSPKPPYNDCEVIILADNRNINMNKSGKDSTISESHSKSSNHFIGENVNESDKVKVKELISNDEPIAVNSSNADKKSRKRGGKKRKTSIKQVDGPNDSNDDDDNDHENQSFVIPQLDGSDSSGSKKKTKPNLKKLNARLQLSENPDSYKRGSNRSLKALQKSNNEKGEPSNSIFSSSQSSYFSSPDKTIEKKSVDVRGDIINLLQNSINQEKQKKSLAKHRKTRLHTADSDSDSDFVPISSEKKSEKDNLGSKIKVKRRVLPRKELDKCVLRDNENEKKKGVDLWVEVFLENEEKWISVDVLKGNVHCIKEIYTRASHPISYILSWDNSNYIKDVTQRYCTTNWNTVTRKQRVQPEWWSQTLKPFEGPETTRQREEDEELEQQHIDQPLPKIISEYKSHPLYALKRHLLKFEAIYPAEAPPLGFIRNEPVYSRMCIHTLHSREIWVKHAKVVKPKETPYKIVKARPKYDRHSNTFITDQPLEIFGSWQVGDYIPPIAENGIVPKNAYGNVELFKKCMLPKGTKHLDLPGLQKVARKLNIDCAPAVVGFDFHGGYSHPTFEGFVVCEEFVDILTDAWHQEQVEAEKREHEKIDKRVYGNWRKLIKGLLISERLQKRYGFAQPSTSAKNKSKLVLKKNRLCSDSDSE